LEEEDHAFTDSGTLVTNALQVVCDPEPVGETLHDEGVLFSKSSLMHTACLDLFVPRSHVERAISFM
jgi:hypothetical protein